MFQNFYDRVIVLSQSHRSDRRKQFIRHAEEIGLVYDFFFSLEMPTPRESFNYSHYAILEQCAKAGYEKVLVLEDDCEFVGMSKFHDIHSELSKEDWYWVYYGANARPYPDHKQPAYCTRHLRLISSAFTTHAIGYTHKLITAVLWGYKPSGGEMFDSFLDRVILASTPAHISIPFLCVQKPAFSDLWNRNVDYSDTFKASEEYLRDIC